MFKAKKYITSLLILLFAAFASAQISDEQVRVQRKYTPKIKAVKQTKVPPGDSVYVQKKDKLAVDYNLIDIEPVSDFEAQPITPSEVVDEEKTYFENYVKVGAGNPGNLLGEGFITRELNERHKLGLNFDHFSINEVDNDIPFDSDAAHTNIELFAKSDFDFTQLRTSVSYERQKINYFGLGDPAGFTFSENPDLKQVYSVFGLNLKATEFDGFFNGKAGIEARYLSDSYNVDETFIGLNFNLNKGPANNFDFLSGLDFSANLEGLFSYSDTSFSDFIDREFRYITGGLKPTFKIQSNRAKLELGGEVLYQKETVGSDGKFHIFPHLLLNYSLTDLFGFYGGLNGSLNQNLFNDMRRVNPYLFASQNIQPTVENLHAFAGIKGAYAGFLSYDVKGFYKNVENSMFFVKSANAFGLRNYGFLNSFEAAYSDGNLFGGEASADLISFDRWGLGATARYTFYDLSDLDNHYSLPNLSGEIRGYYKLMDDKLVLNSDLFFVGKRPNLNFNNTSFLTPVEEDLDAYFDLNFGAEYAITPQWLGFVNFHNVLNADYETFSDYGVQGFQVLAGARYRFGKISK